MMQGTIPRGRKAGDSMLAKPIPVLLGVGLLCWLLSRADLRTIANMLATTDLRWFLVGGVTYLVSSGLRAFRFVRLNRLPLDRVSSMTAVVLAMSLANQILPARLGELSYVYLARKTEDLPLGQGFLSLIVARLWDLVTIGSLFALAAVYLQGQLPSRTRILVWAAAGCSALAVMAVIALVAWRGFLFRTALNLLNRSLLARLPAQRKLVRMVRDMEVGLALMGGSVHFGSTLLCSVAVWLSSFGMTHALLMSLGVSVTLGETVVGASLAALASILPINSIGSFGTLEAGWTAGFVLVGMDPDLALATGFAIHLLALAHTVACGLPAWGWLLWSGRRSGAREARRDAT